MPHPYSTLPERNFWKSAVSNRSWPQVFTDEKGRFTLGQADIVATAGSCFAQRISQVLIDSGLNFAQFERAHHLMSASQAVEHGYGRFSARYGNLYTPRQLLQLVEEAFGTSPPRFIFEKSKTGQVIDLLRPKINDVGFVNKAHARADRMYHLQCVQKLFRESSVFIFTLGLTEAWIGSEHGAVFGVHPSVALGKDSLEKVDRVNFDYIECFNDMVTIINFVRKVNPDLKFIFTVSPVALAATHQNQHVVLATSYSKSVLRAVVGRIVELCPWVDYFPSFEIFNSAQSHGQYLSEDLRDVNQRGVQLAMHTFKQMYIYTTDAKPQAVPDSVPATREQSAADKSEVKSTAAAECDEVLNALFEKSNHEPVEQ